MIENATTLWGFLGVIAVGIFGVIGQQIQARRDAKEAKGKAAIAAENAQQAADNTKPVSNGFAARVDSKLDRILAKQDDLETAHREHLEWHLRQRGGDET